MHFQKFEKYALFKNSDCDFWRAGPPGHLTLLCVSVGPLSLNRNENPIESETLLGKNASKNTSKKRPKKQRKRVKKILNINLSEQGTGSAFTFKSGFPHVAARLILL